MFVATVRLKASSSQLTFDLWRVLSKEKKIQAAVMLNGKDKSVIFITSSAGEKQRRVVLKGGFQVWKETNLHQRNLFFEVTHCNRQHLTYVFNSVSTIRISSDLKLPDSVHMYS